MKLLRDFLPRFNLDIEHIERLVSENSRVQEKFGLPIDSSLIIENPYAVSESYVGNDPDDIIPWATIDRGTPTITRVGWRSTCRNGV